MLVESGRKSGESNRVTKMSQNLNQPESMWLLYGLEVDFTLTLRMDGRE